MTEATTRAHAGGTVCCLSSAFASLALPIRPTAFRPIAIGLAFFASMVVNAAAAPLPSAVSIKAEASTNRVGRYERIDFALSTTAPFTDPYEPRDIEVWLQVKTPAGKELAVPAFFGQPYERRPGQRDWFYPVGMPRWQGRFAPAELGQFTVTARVNYKAKTAEFQTATAAPIRFECVPSDNPGYLRVSKMDPRFLEFSGGRPFFALGQNLAFIGNQQYVSLSKAEQIFKELHTNGANYLRIWTCCEDWAMAIEARKSAWGRSWDWRPNIVPAPNAPEGKTKCLEISGKPLRVDSSHAVALRPQTAYIVTGTVRTEPGTSLCLRVGGKTAPPVTSATSEAWVQLKFEFETGPGEMWLNGMELEPQGAGKAWLLALSLKEAAGGPELLWEADVNRPVRGFYNPVDCFMLDQLVHAAEREQMYLQLCLLTRDLYMDALKNPAGEEYDLAIRDAQKTFRYAIARWGYSTAVGAWEYWNEMDPGRPTDRFYTALGEFLERTDTYGHLRTTSTWGPSPRDCQHPKLDLADVHFYLRPSDKDRLANEVEAVLERTKWLREQAPKKPAHLGEFGLANEKWQPTAEMGQSRELIDVHNALWASVLSGASGSAMYWWWDRLDQRNVYPIYGAISPFIADIPWNSGLITNALLSCSDTNVRPVGLRAGDRVWLWLFSQDASWSKMVLEKGTPAHIKDLAVQVKGVGDGPYVLRWYDTRSGELSGQSRAEAKAGTLSITVPEFARDLACKLAPADAR